MADEKAGSLFDSRHYVNPADYVILAQNTTTSTSVEKPGEIQLVELSDNGFLLDMPQRTCAAGHHLLIRILARKSLVSVVNKDASGQHKALAPMVTVTCRVESVERSKEEGRTLARLELNQVDPREWRHFIEKITENQSNANRLLRELKK